MRAEPGKAGEGAAAGLQTMELGKAEWGILRRPWRQTDGGRRMHRMEIKEASGEIECWLECWVDTATHQGRDAVGVGERKRA